MTDKIKVYIDAGCVVFARKNYDFYDICLTRLNMDRLDEKQWFTSEVKHDLVVLLDDISNEN